MICHNFLEFLKEFWSFQDENYPRRMVEYLLTIKCTFCEKICKIYNQIVWSSTWLRFFLLHPWSLIFLLIITQIKKKNIPWGSWACSPTLCGVLSCRKGRFHIKKWIKEKWGTQKRNFSWFNLIPLFVFLFFNSPNKNIYQIQILLCHKYFNAMAQFASWNFIF